MATEQTTFSFTHSGESIARNTSQSSRLVAELGEHLAAECKTLDAWNAARAAFIAGATSAGYAAPQDLWERTLKTGREWGVVPDKPKAETAAATTKAAERTRASEAIQGKTAVELKAEADAKAEAGDYVAAAKLQKAADTAVKTAQREAIKVAKDECAPLIAAIKSSTDLMLKANDRTGLGHLAKVAQCLAQGQHASVAKAIKALKVKEETTN
jgi:hypothetical protein